MFRHSRKTENRRGTEIVELAIAMPLLTVLVFGVLETCEVLFLKQSASVACYEAVRVAARPRGTATSARDRCQEILTQRRVNNATITIEPADLSELNRGDPITITIRAPIAGNRTTALVVSDSVQVIQTNTMVRE